MQTSGDAIWFYICVRVCVAYAGVVSGITTYMCVQRERVYGCCVPKNGLASNVALEETYNYNSPVWSSSGRMRWLSSLLWKTKSQNWLRRELGEKAAARSSKQTAGECWRHESGRGCSEESSARETSLRDSI